VFKKFVMLDLTALSSSSVRVIATFLNFYVSHGSTARFSRGGEKYYTHLYLFCR